MTTTTKVTKEQAEQALAAVKEQFKVYLEPIVISAEESSSGEEKVLSPCCPEPTLVENWQGWAGGTTDFAILWEDGPDDWAYRATSGGYSEEEFALSVAAAKEFGVEAGKPKQEEPVTWPKGIWAEPYCSFILCLYPE